jgi:hypothetical protein
MELIYKHVGNDQYQLVAEFLENFPPFEGDFLNVHAPSSWYLKPPPADELPTRVQENVFEVRLRKLKNEKTGDLVWIYETVSDLSKIDSPKLKLVKDGPYL